MAADQTVSASRLSEGDIPGASLQGRNPTTLTTDELRFWLKCRSDPAKGNKNKGTVSKKASKLIDVFLSSRNNKGFYILYLVKRIRYLTCPYFLFQVEIRRFNVYFRRLPVSAQLTGVLIFP